MAEKWLLSLRRANQIIAIVVGLIVLVCMGFVLLDIVLRQLNHSLGGTDEISGYVMAIVSSWGMGYALIELAHVRIDVIRGRVGQKWRSIIDLCSMLVLAVVITLVAYYCYPVLEKSLANTSRANTALETPLWLVQVPWLLGWVWFALVAWLTVTCSLLLVIRADNSLAQRFIGVNTEENL